MNKRFVIIGGGLLAIALVVVLVLVNLPVQSAEIVPTNISSLPDLALTSAYVSMVSRTKFNSSEESALPTHDHPPVLITVYRQESPKNNTIHWAATWRENE